MDKIIIDIKTSENEKYSKEIILPASCGSEFFCFPDEPYNEFPEFMNNFAIGSAGTVFIEKGKPKTQQVILRLDNGHPGLPNQHINVEFGTMKETKPVRTRETVAHLKMPEWVEIKMKSKEGEHYKKINFKRSK